MFSPTGQRFTSTPHTASGKGNTMELMVCKHLELKELIDEKVLELTQELIILEKAVETLKDPIERAVMRYRYFEEYSWEKIGEVLHYSQPQLYRYHGYALLNLKEIGPDGYRFEEAEVPREPEEDDLCARFEGPCLYCDEDCEGCEYYEEE